MECYLFKLKFNGPTHFGETGIDLENVSERVQSDTLFSAFVNVYKVINGDDETTKFINEFKKSPKFIFSSLFVYSGNNYFLPKPLADSHLDRKIKRTFGKDLKGIKWLDLEYFSKWYKGLSGKDIVALQKVQKEYERAFKVDIRPRVSLDRKTSQSNIFHSAFVYFKKDAGLYGLVYFYDKDFISQFKNFLEILGGIGLGGEKAYGCGMYEVETFEKVPSEFKELLMSDINCYTLLSLYHPDSSEFSALKHSLIAYDLIRKRGWITSGRNALPYKRKSLGFFIEGSVFKERPRGSMVDVTPDEIYDTLKDKLNHKIYRYGFAFTIPIGAANR